VNETCSSSGNSVTISCPLRNTVPRSSSMRLNSSKKFGAVVRPRSRKHVNSDKLPSVSNRMPPSKFRMSLWPDFSFFFGFCCWVEIGFRAEEPNGGGIVRVAGKKQPVGAIEQTDGVRRVARRGNNFQLAAAPEIDLETIVNRDGDSPGFCGIRFWVKSLRQIATELIRRDFGLGVFARTLCIRAREICVHAKDEWELPIAANGVVVCVRVEHHHGTQGQFRSHRAAGA